MVKRIGSEWVLILIISSDVDNVHRKEQANTQKYEDKPSNIFLISLVRPGTRFDLTCSHLVGQRQRSGNKMFQCNKIVTLEMTSQ